MKTFILTILFFSIWNQISYSQETKTTTIEKTSLLLKNKNPKLLVPKIVKGDLGQYFAFLQNIERHELVMDFSEEKFRIGIATILDARGVYDAYIEESVPSYRLLVTLAADYNTPCFTVEILNESEASYRFNKKTGVLSVSYAKYKYKKNFDTKHVPLKWRTDGYAHDVTRKLYEEDINLKDLYLKLKKQYGNQGLWNQLRDPIDYVELVKRK